MMRSQLFRVLFVGTLVVSTVGVVAIASILLWPEWQRYQAVRALVRSIEATDSSRLPAAIERIDKFRAGESAFSHVVALTSDHNANVRMRACLALSLIRPRCTAAIPVLIEALDRAHEDDAVRAAAAFSLGQFREVAIAAVPALVRAAEQSRHKEDWTTYRISVEALMDMAQGDKFFAQARLGFISWAREIPPDADAPPRKIAAFALRHVDPEAVANAGVQ